MKEHQAPDFAADESILEPEPPRAKMINLKTQSMNCSGRAEFAKAGGEERPRRYYAMYTEVPLPS